MFQNFSNFQNFQIFKFQNFKKYSEIRGATSISDAFIFDHLGLSWIVKENLKLSWIIWTIFSPHNHICPFFIFHIFPHRKCVNSKMSPHINILQIKNVSISKDFSTWLKNSPWTMFATNIILLNITVKIFHLSSLQISLSDPSPWMYSINLAFYAPNNPPILYVHYWN